ncbi:MAG: protein-glutamate O-methyltransferase CheR [Salinibacter sp.]
MSDDPYTAFLQWVLPRLGKRWEGYRKVQNQVESRLTDRLQELGLRSLDAYRDYLGAHPDEWNRLDAMTRITVSRFYRDPEVFDCLRNEVLPAVAWEHFHDGDGPLRAWSVGAASSEEPYTLRILWRHVLRDRFEGRELQVTASEARAHMLERGRRGCYQRGTLTDLPESWIDRAFRYDPALDAGEHAEPYCLRPVYRRHVTWRHEDIRTQRPDGPFSLVCCRNLVFTYFNCSLQKRILRQLLARLRPGGALVLGTGESLPEPTESLVQIEETLPLYRHRPL